MIRAVAAGAAILLASAVATAQSVTLRSGAREVTVALAQLGSRAIEVRDPTDGNKRKTFYGAPLADALSKLPAAPGADAIAVRCDDGWLSLVPLATVQKFPGALLAVGEQAAGSRTPLSPPRGPVFLAWPNVEKPAIDRDRDLTPNGWTWGVASLEYVRLADFATPLALPAGATAAARRGQTLFQFHCLHCHAINGAGGMAGWDLNQPSILTYRAAPYVRAYILDPRRTNPDGHMAPFKGKLKHAELDALLEFLRALQK